MYSYRLVTIIRSLTLKRRPIISFAHCVVGAVAAPFVAVLAVMVLANFALSASADGSGSENVGSGMGTIS